MIGRVINDEFSLNRDWPMASTIAVALLVLLVVPIMLYNHMQAALRRERSNEAALDLPLLPPCASALPFSTSRSFR